MPTNSALPFVEWTRMRAVASRPGSVTQRGASEVVKTSTASYVSAAVGVEYGW